MNSSPLVSVLIVCYNHQKFIKECIVSIHNQTYPNIELVVIDNSDNDKSKIIIDSMLLEGNFRFIKQENIGLPKTLNKYIPLLKGKYCIFMSGDDFMLSDRIEKQVKFMESNPDYAMGYANTIAVNELSYPIGYIRDKRYKSGYIFNELIRFKFHPPAPSYIFKRSIFDEVGLYDENIKFIEDRYMNIKIAQNHKIGFLNEYVSYHRQHSNNLSRSIPYDLQLKDVYYILEQYRNLTEFKSILYDINLYFFCTFSNNDLRLGYRFMILAFPKIFTIDYLKSTLRLIRKTFVDLSILAIPV